MPRLVKPGRMLWRRRRLSGALLRCFVVLHEACEIAWSCLEPAWQQRQKRPISCIYWRWGLLRRLAAMLVRAGMDAWVLTKEVGTSSSSNSVTVCVAKACVSHRRVYIRLAVVAQAMFALGGASVA